MYWATELVIEYSHLLAVRCVTELATVRPHFHPVIACLHFLLTYWRPLFVFALHRVEGLFAYGQT
jgi:hypothetical protein